MTRGKTSPDDEDDTKPEDEEGIEPDEEGGDDLPPEPAFLKDEPPDPAKQKTMFVKWCLMHGKSEEELVAEGANPGTVRVCAQELEKDGYRERPKKPPKDTTTAVAASPGKGIQIFARGSPPEALIDSLNIPIPGGEVFQKGMKFGASMIVLGVRVAQELSSLGIGQAKPVMDMAREMRSGEAAAAKGAATEAAMMAASEVGANILPHLANIGKGSEADPMKSMMVRTMEPLITRMMSKMIPGGGAVAPELPGWSRKRIPAPAEEPKEEK